MQERSAAWEPTSISDVLARLDDATLAFLAKSLSEQLEVKQMELGWIEAALAKKRGDDAGA